MANKPFDKKLFAQFDQLAKDYALKVLREAGLTVKNHPRKMSVDLIVTENDQPAFYVETEIKRYLNGNEPFAFTTLHLPSRKIKFCQLDLPTLFILFSEEGHRFLCVWSQYVLSSPLVEVNNKYVHKGESFADIDIAKYVDDSIEKALKRRKA